MQYRDVKRKFKELAADHLWSLEVYDEFEPGDEEKVDRAREEVMSELKRHLTKRAADAPPGKVIE